MGLARSANLVSLSYRRERIVRIKKKNEDRLAELVQQGKVELLMPTELVEVRPETVLLAVRGALTEIANDFVFIFAGGQPPWELLPKMGIRFGDDERPAPPKLESRHGSGAEAAP